MSLDKMVHEFISLCVCVELFTAFLHVALQLILL